MTLVSFSATDSIRWRRKPRRASGSRLATGSSRMSNSGRFATATVRASCARCPPDSLPAFCFGSRLSCSTRARVEQLNLDPKQKAGKLSGGQRAQLALTVAVAKRPELLILDEPVASLDPLARRGFLRHLMESVAENDTSVILSSHLVSDLERVCDYLVVLVSSRVHLAGETEELLAQHYRIVCTRRAPSDLPAGLEVIWAEHSDRQSTFVARTQTAL